MRTLRRCAVAALVLALVAGCSGKASNRAGSPGSGKTGGGTATPGASGTGTQPSGVGSQTGPGATGGPASSPNPSQTNPDDFISAFANENVNWDCQMRPGELCKVYVQGSYFLRSSNVGGIQIVAFENGSTTPVEESVVRPVPAGGTPFNATFGYRIGQNAVTFTIQAYLKDDRGIVVAKSRAQTFRVNRS